MSSERDVLAVLARANPVPDPDAITVETDASRYLEELIDEGAPRRHGHKSSHPRRWIVPVVAAAAVAMLLLGLIAVSGGDADAPVTTTPPATTTTTHDGSDTSRDAAAVVTRFFDAYRTGDADTVQSLLTDGVTITERYEGAQIYWGDTARFVSPIPTSIDDLVTRIEQGETLTEPTCQSGTLPISCTYSMQVVANGSAVSIPVRARFHFRDGLIDELQYGYGNNSSEWNSAVDDLIFRTHPGLWNDVFGQVSTPEEAAEQARQQAAWVEIAMAECGTISHCRSPKVPAPTIPASQQLELESQIRTRWNEPGGDLYSSWPDCLVDPYSPIDVGEGGWAYTSYREPLQPGLPSLWIEAPASMSAEQSEVIVGWILDAATCDPAATILPPESAARGYIANDENAVFAVTDPRGGVVWMMLSGGNVTVELIDELAALAQQHLDDGLANSTTNE